MGSFIYTPGQLVVSLLQGDHQSGKNPGKNLGKIREFTRHFWWSPCYFNDCLLGVVGERSDKSECLCHPCCLPTGIVETIRRLGGTTWKLDLFLVNTCIAPII